MRLPDGSTLMHAGQPYDPAKAHEYYLRVRKLTGRKKGQAKTPLTLVPSKASAKKTTKTADQKIKQIKAKLDLLSRRAHSGPGDIQKRTGQEAAAAAKKAQSTRAAAADEVQTAQTKLAELNQSFKKKMAAKAPASETDPLKQSINDAQEKLKAATEKFKNLGSAPKSG